MSRRLIQIAVLLLVAATIGLAATVQGQSPEPTTLYQAAYPDIQMTFTEVQVVIDLEPGAAFPLHHHGGPTLALVLDGEIVRVQDGEETVFKAGDSWTETPANIHSAYNATDAPARVLATFLLPPGAVATSPEPDAEVPPIAPVITYRASFPDITMNSRFSIDQTVQEFAPGAGMPLHEHGGPALVMVLEGVITLRENGEERVYAAGESWTELPGSAYEVFNNGDAPVRVAVTVLVPEGAEATTLQEG